VSCAWCVTSDACCMLRVAALSVACRVSRVALLRCLVCLSNLAAREPQTSCTTVQK
jgi:hypothetical protein